MSTSQKKKQMTLLQAMERVVELSKDSQMSQEFMKKAKAEIQLLAKSYEITERQVVLFCVCMEKGPRRVDYDDLASHLDISKIKMMGYATDIDALVRRRLLKYRDVKDEEDFDVPQIKSKWVGDSEKNIKALFDRYREVVKRSKLAPILLFNEADAIIGKRQEGAERAVEKMENSIQNIILQEIENLDGIMIATTNLQQNMDTAFERRFLYKNYKTIWQ